MKGRPGPLPSLTGGPCLCNLPCGPTGVRHRRRCAGRARAGAARPPPQEVPRPPAVRVRRARRRAMTRTRARWQRRWPPALGGRGRCTRAAGAQGGGRARRHVRGGTPLRQRVVGRRRVGARGQGGGRGGVELLGVASRRGVRLHAHQRDRHGVVGRRRVEPPAPVRARRRP